MAKVIISREVNGVFQEFDPTHRKMLCNVDFPKSGSMYKQYKQFGAGKRVRVQVYGYTVTKSPAYTFIVGA